MAGLGLHTLTARRIRAFHIALDLIGREMGASPEPEKEEDRP